MNIRDVLQNNYWQFFVSSRNGLAQQPDSFREILGTSSDAMEPLSISFINLPLSGMYTVINLSFLPITPSELK